MIEFSDVSSQPLKSDTYLSFFIFAYYYWYFHMVEYVNVKIMTVITDLKWFQNFSHEWEVKWVWEIFLATFLVILCFIFINWLRFIPFIPGKYHPYQIGSYGNFNLHFFLFSAQLLLHKSDKICVSVFFLIKKKKNASGDFYDVRLFSSCWYFCLCFVLLLLLRMINITLREFMQDLFQHIFCRCYCLYLHILWW